jgi:lipid A 3-O-deacylase
MLGDSAAMYVRLDNDAFADRDWGYTSGIKVGFISPTLDTFQDARLTPRLRALNRRLAWLQPRGFDDYNVSISIGQDMFTPEDWRLTEVDPLDRPYAGVLAAGITYNGRNAQTMRSTSLSVGLVGPSSGAEELQSLLHELNGSHEFHGWEHQLNDEPVLRVLHQRARKWDLVDAVRMSDAIVHYGGSIGNLTAFANGGVELRFGRALPDNFGSAPALPGLENTAPTRMVQFAQRSSMHGYVALDARYVLRDITLDGNTWRDSPSVAREDLVVDFGVGFALYWQGWKVTFARYVRTKEFEGQSAGTRLGSITIRRSLAE